MKKLLVAIAIMLAVSPAFAQTVPAAPAAPAKQAPVKAAKAPKALAAPEQRAAQYADELKAKLNLTDDQYKKVLAVNTECIRRKDALKASGQKDVAGKKEIAAYRKQQYQAILTPDQQAKLKAMNAQHHDKGEKDKDAGENK